MLRRCKRNLDTILAAKAQPVYHAFFHLHFKRNLIQFVAAQQHLLSFALKFK